MKNKFILGLAVVAMVVAMAVPAFAAQKGWSQAENGQWSYIDNNGDKVTEKWEKSGDDWYWLNSDGIVATAQLVDDGSHMYCVDETGKMIHNNWVFVNTEEYEERWMYFGATGRVYENGWKEIKGKKYFFEDKCMNYGFLDADGKMIDKDNDEAWKEAVYYCGSNQDGAQKKNEWIKVDDMDADNGSAWIFFGANGKKVVDCKKTINGQTYVFGDNGAMKTSFVDATVSSASISVYMNEDGAMLKKGWIFAYANDNAEEQNWFYAQGNGELVKDTIKNINGKKYAFDSEGKMLTGFVGVVNNAPVFSVSAEDCKKDDLYLNSVEFMYFTESATPSEQGAAKTGKIAVEVSDGTATLNLSSRGIGAADGEQVKKGYFYINSVLYDFAEADYKYEPRVINGIQYVVTLKTGKASTKGTFIDNDNEIKYILKDGILTTQHKNSAGKWE